MHIRDIIRAPKANIRFGQWHTGKVPKKDFPIAKNSYNVGSAYKWSVISFSACGAECRVLVIFNEAKQKYEAILGVMGVTGSLCVLCSYEYHQGEPGWHVHTTHAESTTLSSGFMRGPWIRRIPEPKKIHRATKHTKFKIGDEKSAIHFALARYRIGQKGPLL